MRIALCLSGMMRHTDISFKFIYKNLLEPYNGYVDVFAHTWRYESDNVYNYIEELSIFQPTKSLIEYNNRIELKRDYPRGTSPRYPAYNIFSLFKSVQQANNLKSQYEHENDFKFDIVIRMRYDYALNVAFHYEALCLDNIIAAPFDLYERGLITDQFAIGTSKTMDVYASMFDYLDQYYDEGEDMVGEHMITRHMKKNHIEIGRVDMKHLFLPYNGDSLPNSLIRKNVLVNTEKWN